MIYTRFLSSHPLLHVSTKQWKSIPATELKQQLSVLTFPPFPLPAGQRRLWEPHLRPPVPFLGGFSLATRFIPAKCRMRPASVAATTCTHFHAEHDPSKPRFFIPETCGTESLCSLQINCAQWLFHVSPVCLFWQAWTCKLCQHLARSTCPK